jgi:hypothetical protein
MVVCLQGPPEGWRIARHSPWVSISPSRLRGGTGGVLKNGQGLAAQHGFLLGVSKSGFYGVGIRQKGQRRPVRVLGSPAEEDISESGATLD